jgi:hypothetical protein
MDNTQRGWAVGSIAFCVIAAIAYVLYASHSTVGARGGTAMGLLFGSLGFGFMMFAALLGARKRVPTWRIGRAQAWMRGHLWLGLLSLPLILFHGGFHFGGTLTRVLMWLLMITVASGLFGAALQNYIPQMMTSDVPLETIYDEISHVRQGLRDEADKAVEAICGPLQIAHRQNEGEQLAGGFTALRPIAASSAPVRTSAAVSAGASAAVAAAPEIILLSDEQSAVLRNFYLSEMRLYLENPQRRGQRLGSADKATRAFGGLRTLLPPVAQATIQDLQDICDEARQLLLQERLHHWLHGWLLLHIPLSLALIILGAAHAVMALRY